MLYIHIMCRFHRFHSSGVSLITCPRSRVKTGVKAAPFVQATRRCIQFRMVAELVRPTSDNRRGSIPSRTAQAGGISLRGTARWTEQTSRAWTSVCGIYKWLGAGFWTLVFITCGVGTAFIYEMATADGSPASQTGAPTEMQQLGAMMQQMMLEQQRQRDRLEELGQAVQGTGAAIQGTQSTTEQVIQQVVAQVQAGFQHEQQQHQDQLSQMSQAMQTIQTQVQQIPVAQNDQLQQIGQAVQTLQAQAQQQVSPEQFQQFGQVIQSLQGQVQQMSGAAASGGIGMSSPPQAPSGSPHPQPPQQSGPPPTFQFGSGATPGSFGFSGTAGASISPAVAYAIQQGGVDGRQLGKPATFNPTESKVSFQDWSDSVITLADSAMPGIYECLEWIVTEQPKHALDLAYMKVKFAHLDGALLGYAESNIYAILSSYAAGEAKSLVRQAKRPNGMEAFRLLQVRFNPVTIGRQRAHLMKIANPQESISLEKLSAEIVSWENRIVDYEARPNAEKVSEAMKMAALIHMAPAKLREHLQLNAGRFVRYLDLREEVFSYLDQVTPASHTTMDIGSISRSGGCYNCGGPHLARDCTKPKNDKGKGKGFKGKGGKDGGGKGKSKGKFGGKDGKGKTGGKKGDGKQATRSNCGKAGHTFDACWSKPKPLNAVDPKLAEMQSAYAKAAMEDYKRLQSGASSSSASPPLILHPPSPPSPQSPKTTSTAAHVGSLVVRSLCALSRRALDISREVFRNSTPACVQRHLTRVVAGPNEVLATIDSGAAASVSPPGVFHGWPTEDPEPGLTFQAADGTVVPEMHKVQPVVITEEGFVRQTQFSVASVNKVLVSAAEVANRGHRVVLSPYYMESYIEDLATGEIMKLQQQDGVYVQRLTVHVPEDLGFYGQAPDSVPSVL